MSCSDQQWCDRKRRGASLAIVLTVQIFYRARLKQRWPTKVRRTATLESLKPEGGPLEGHGKGVENAVTGVTTVGVELMSVQRVPLSQ